MLGFASVSVHSQHIPDLKKSFSNASSDTSKIDTGIKLIYSYGSINLDSSLYYFNKIVITAEEILDIKRINKAFVECFYAHFDRAKYHEAKIIANQELETGRRLKSDLLIARSYILKSNLYWELSDFAKFYETLSIGLEYAKKSKDRNILALVYNSFANFYTDRRELEKGRENRMKALELYEETNDSLNIGILYYNMSIGFIEKENYDSSLYYSNHSLSYLPNSNSTPYDFSIGRKAEALFFLGKENEGLELLNTNIKRVKRNQLKRSFIFLNKIKAKCLTKQKKYKEAIKAAEIGVDVSHEIGYDGMLISLTDILTENNKAIHNYKKSLYWSEEKIKLNEMFATKLKDSEVAKLEANHELQKKEAENQVLILKNKIQKFLFIILLAGGLILFAVGYAFLKRQQRKQFSEFKETVAADLHDDVGSNLNSISRMAKELKSQSNGLGISEHIDILVEKTNRSIKNVVDVVWIIDDKKLELGQLIERMESHLDNVKTANPEMKVKFVKKNLNERKTLSTKQKHHLLMIFKEAIDNIQEHTNSSEIKIVMENLNNGLSLTIVNLFDSKKYTHDSTGLGLVNIRKRVMELDGYVEFKEDENKFEVDFQIKKI